MILYYFYQGYKVKPEGPARNPLNSVVAKKGQPQNEVQGVKAAPQAKTPFTGVALKSLNELKQRSKGFQFRVAVNNISFTATEDELIQAINSKGKRNEFREDGAEVN